VSARFSKKQTHNFGDEIAFETIGGTGQSVSDGKRVAPAEPPVKVQSQEVVNWAWEAVAAVASVNG